MRGLVAALLWLLASAPASAQFTGEAKTSTGSPFRALVPSAQEQLDARASRLEKALVRVLSTVPGVRSAEATVALADTSSASLDKPLPPPRVTALLVLHEGAPTPERARLDELIASVARELAEAEIHIDTSYAIASPPRADAHGETLVAVGPFRVAKESAGPIRAALAASLLANVMLATLLLWRWRRTAPHVFSTDQKSMK